MEPESFCKASCAGADKDGTERAQFALLEPSLSATKALARVGAARIQAMPTKRLGKASCRSDRYRNSHTSVGTLCVEPVY